ncbi:MAG: hypothetical protein ABIY55_34680, partial [Kofleriaceae bacterium]
MYERTLSPRATHDRTDARRRGRRIARGAVWLGLVTATLAPRVAVAEPAPAQVADAGDAKPSVGALSAERPALIEAPSLASRSTPPAPDAPMPIQPAPVVRPSTPAQPAAAVRPSLLAVRTSERPRIDGVLDDRAWQGTPGTDAFTQKFPADGVRPSERTDLRIVYDDAALYVAFDCEQRTTPLIARLARRDRDVGADRVEIDLSDGARTFAFWVSAAGVVGDGIRFNDTDYSADWDGVWDA